MLRFTALVSLTSACEASRPFEAVSLLCEVLPKRAKFLGVALSRAFTLLRAAILTAHSSSSLYCERAQPRIDAEPEWACACAGNVVLSTWMPVKPTECMMLFGFLPPENYASGTGSGSGDDADTVLLWAYNQKSSQKCAALLAKPHAHACAPTVCMCHGVSVGLVLWR